MYQKALEAYLVANELDVEVDMWKIGNLEMACRATLEALEAGNKPFPMGMHIASLKH